MNATLGTTCVALGLVASVAGVVTVAWGLVTRNPSLVVRSRTWAWMLAVAAVGQVAVMERALITRDFTVAFVAEHGSHRTPALFNVATLWSALEGSILLWVLVLVGYLVLVVRRFRDRLDDPMVGWTLLVMFAVCTFFFLLLAGPAQPFGRFEPWAGYDGPGPNPLLQNHVLMAFHPPVLYLGYVGFTVPFALAVAALATGRLGEGWLLEARRWTLIAWGCLTVGIILGAWWSYEVLGWGGYWAWDPVENASFLPWLTGTAYLHSVMVQERQGMLRVWNLSLLCATFALTILGTFITRSGVLESVHAFTESGIGPLLLGFFALVVVTTVGLIAWRGDALRAPGSIESPVSRTGAFLANNLLFGAFAFVVLLGTVFPLLVEAARGDRIAVGNPYFERMTMPVGFALLFLMAVAPALPWGRGTTEVLSARLRWPAAAGATAMVVGVVVGSRGWAPPWGWGPSRPAGRSGTWCWPSGPGASGASWVDPAGEWSSTSGWPWWPWPSPARRPSSARPSSGSTRWVTGPASPATNWSSTACPPSSCPRRPRPGWPWWSTGSGSSRPSASSRSADRPSGRRPPARRSATTSRWPSWPCRIPWPRTGREPGSRARWSG